MEKSLMFSKTIKDLKSLQLETEDQILDFNKIVPLEHNLSNVYSPKLVNIILQAGPQIEAIVDAIMKELGLSSNGGVPSKIKKINEKGMLNKLDIHFIPNKIGFLPFKDVKSWWEDVYNKTKHDLVKNQFSVRYSSVMQLMAALAALHRFAHIIKSVDYDLRDHLLEEKYWVSNLQIPNWKSKAFKISQYFRYDSNNYF